MTIKEDSSGRADQDNRSAEEKAGLPEKQQLKPFSAPAENFQESHEDTRKILHELRVHQIELEMQNEELHRTQGELESARARYFDLYDLAPVGYCTISEKGMILEANLTAATLLGLPRGALVKLPFTLFILRESQDIYYLHRRQLFETGIPQSYELQMVKKDGTVFWARLEVTATKNPEGESFCRVMISDINEHKHIEETLQNAQKLESIGLLAGGIAHDFNNIMGGVFGNIDLANEQNKDSVVATYLSNAINCIGRARELTAQLLTFAKGGAPVQKNTALIPFVQEVATFALRGSNISCHFSIAKDLWSCNIDKSQISQVIDNILINAQQAMPDGGTIEISAINVSLKEKELPLLPKGNFVKISIRDHGKGIPKEIMPRIFDPFFTTKLKGHGLGLATSYSIIKRHGGTITVESEPDKGSTFHFYLLASAETIPETVVSDVKHKGCGTILVMDDEKMIRDTFTKMLEIMGYMAISAKDGREALDFFIEDAKTNHALVAMIFDLTIPGGMGGKEAISEIRKLNSDIPVFVASGYSEDPVMKTPKKFGFTASLCKPFRKVELAAMLEKYLNKKT